jgi:uncharacterized membrane protein YhaH (DUF805 family)
MDWWAFFFSFRGRINRAKYWLALLIFTIVGVVQILGGLALGNAMLIQMFNFLIDIAILVASIAVAIKRLHDRDRSAWWLLLFYLGPFVLAGVGGGIMWAGERSIGLTEDWSLFPRLGLLAGLALLIWGLVEIGFRRGTAGYNRFGPDPLAKQQSRA